MYRVDITYCHYSIFMLDSTYHNYRIWPSHKIVTIPDFYCIAQQNGCPKWKGVELSLYSLVHDPAGYEPVGDAVRKGGVDWRGEPVGVERLHVADLGVAVDELVRAVAVHAHQHHVVRGTILSNLDCLFERMLLLWNFWGIVSIKGQKWTQKTFILGLKPRISISTGRKC